MNPSNENEEREKRERKIMIRSVQLGERRTAAEFYSKEKFFKERSTPIESIIQNKIVIFSSFVGI